MHGMVFMYVHMYMVCMYVRTYTCRYGATDNSLTEASRKYGPVITFASGKHWKLVYMHVTSLSGKQMKLVYMHTAFVSGKHRKFCVCVYIYVCMYVCMYVYIYIYIYIYMQAWACICFCFGQVHILHVRAYLCV